MDRPPNIVFILTDDLGIKDLGVYGSDYHLTPRLDHLAAKGMRVTNAHAASPACSPTRATILNGQDDNLKQFGPRALRAVLPGFPRRVRG